MTLITSRASCDAKKVSLLANFSLQTCRICNLVPLQHLLLTLDFFSWHGEYLDDIVNRSQSLFNFSASGTMVGVVLVVILIMTLMMMMMTMLIEVSKYGHL